MTLQAALALFASGPTAPVLARGLEDALGTEVASALERAGALGEAGLASSLPCAEHDGAVHELRAGSEGAALVAVCDAGACAPVRIARGDARLLSFDRRALSRAIAGLLGVSPDESAQDEERLGTIAARAGRRDGVRDVRVAWDGPARTALLFERLRAGARPALVLAPAASIGRELDGHGGPGEHVELVRLEDVLVVSHGALALAGPIASVPPKLPKPPKRREPTDTGLPRPSAWSELRIYRVDGHTVSVRVGNRHVRRTYADLGMASDVTRGPTKTWELLMAICEGGGTFEVRSQGDSAKKRVSRLRQQLVEVFGLADDPFEPFRPRVGWRVKFVARDDA